MAASSSIMMAATSVSTAYTQSQAMQSQGDYQKQQGETNAKLAEMNATDAIKRGDEAAANHKKMVAGVIGDQRASMGAQGIDLASGSAMDIQQDTAVQGGKDALTIKNNAWREAWGYQVEAQNSRGRGEMAQMAATNSARNTLLTGGLNAVSYGSKAFGGGSTSDTQSYGTRGSRSRAQTFE